LIQIYIKVYTMFLIKIHSIGNFTQHHLQLFPTIKRLLLNGCIIKKGKRVKKEIPPNVIMCRII
jgi:hypothetical protein